LTARERAADSSQNTLRIALALPEVTITIRQQLTEGITIMVMSHIIAPVVPQFFHRHTFWRIFRNVTEPQATPIALEKFSDAFRFFGFMNPRAIGHDDHSSFAFGRTLHTFFNQAAKRWSIALLSSDPHDLARAPIGGTILVPLGRTFTRRTHFALLPSQRPAAFQGREQTQFGFIFYVDIRPAGWMIQEPSNGAFF
jgi:hypothetical protein